MTNDTPFPDFLGKSSRGYGQKIPFPEKWEHTCGPLMYSRYKPYVYDVIISRRPRALGVKTKGLCVKAVVRNVPGARGRRHRISQARTKQWL